LRAVVGLGNPGPEYAPTRHNAGFWVLERLLGRGGWSRRRHPWGEIYLRGGAVLLRPLTYMNRSGEAVAALRELFPIAIEDLLVVYDDVDLPVGEVRLRPGGGPGTHRGMRSVLAALGTEAVPRLRVGIGFPPPEVELSQYVLSPPLPEEVSVLSSSADWAAELAWEFLQGGLQAALDVYARARKQGRV